MKRRHLYLLVFSVPALLTSLIATAMVVAAAAGALWLFVLGDNPWPGWTDPALGALAIASGAAVWLSLMWVAYSVGRQQESAASLNLWHLALAIGSGALLCGAILLRSTGGLPGARTDSEQCADVCRAAGFAASGTPPRDSGDRTCSCYDEQGRAVRQVVLSP